MESKEATITVNGTDNNKEIFNIFKGKLKDNDSGMQQENNRLISRINEVNNFSIKRRTVNL